MTAGLNFINLDRLPGGARSVVVDVLCPVCAPEKSPHVGRRKVLRTRTSDDDLISYSSVSCGPKWYVGDNGRPARSRTSSSQRRPFFGNSQNDRERQRENARQLWIAVARHHCAIATGLRAWAAGSVIIAVKDLATERKYDASPACITVFSDDANTGRRNARAPATGLAKLSSKLVAVTAKRENQLPKKTILRLREAAR